MPQDLELLRLAADITSAHLSNNTTDVDEVPGLIRSIYAAVSSAGTETPIADQLKPAVPVKRSVFPDHIICLEDGQKMRSLKRHLRVSHNLTPDQYRARWGLPDSYPLVAPEYAAFRSGQALRLGLGHKPAAPQDPSSPPIQYVPEGKRGKMMRLDGGAKDVEDG